MHHTCFVQAHPGVVQILVAVVHYRTKLLRPRTVCGAPGWAGVGQTHLTSPSPLPTHHPLQGVCSSWLASLDPALQPTVPVWVTPGVLSLSKVVDKPAILIGPGTGCAPFRALIEERVSAAVSGEGRCRSLPLAQGHCSP